jgi:hypothetical protein
VRHTLKLEAGGRRRLDRIVGFALKPTVAARGSMAAGARRTRAALSTEEFSIPTLDTRIAATKIEAMPP